MTDLTGVPHIVMVETPTAIKLRAIAATNRSWQFEVEPKTHIGYERLLRLYQGADATAEEAALIAAL